MYEKLIDTVSGIIKTYGEGIFDEPKFWYILTDSYSFGNDYALKAVYKKFWEEGLVDKIVTCKGNPVKTKEEINRIVEEYKLKNPRREKEYASVLYSVAIALGTCTKKDYKEFLNPQSATPTSQTTSSPSNNQSSRSNTHPSPTPSPRKRTWPTQQKGYFLTHSEKWSIFWYVFWGIIIAFGSTIIYTSSFNENTQVPLTFIIGYVQLLYLNRVLNLLYKNRPWYFKAYLRSWVIPLLIIICFSAAIPLFFFNASFREAVGYYFGKKDPGIPNFVTFLLSIVYTIILFFGSFCCGLAETRPNFSSPIIIKPIFTKVSLFLLFIYLFFYVFPFIIFS